MAILAYPYPTFQPAMRIVTDITNAFPAVITTSFAHQYETGIIVRLNIPDGFGMTQANHKYAPITVLSDTTFSMPLDTTKFDPFVVPSSFPDNRQNAQCTAIGEVNESILNAERNVLPYPLR